MHSLTNILAALMFVYNKLYHTIQLLQLELKIKNKLCNKYTDY